MTGEADVPGYPGAYKSTVPLPVGFPTAIPAVGYPGTTTVNEPPAVPGSICAVAETVPPETVVDAVKVTLAVNEFPFV